MDSRVQVVGSQNFLAVNIQDLNPADGVGIECCCSGATRVARE